MQNEPVSRIIILSRIRKWVGFCMCVPNLWLMSYEWKWNSFDSKGARAYRMACFWRLTIIRSIFMRKLISYFISLGLACPVASDKMISWACICSTARFLALASPSSLPLSFSQLPPPPPPPPPQSQSGSFAVFDINCGWVVSVWVGHGRTDGQTGSLIQTRCRSVGRSIPPPRENIKQANCSFDE
jgi:hypothetical protein